MRILLCFILCFCIGTSIVMADEATPLLYSRSNILILRKNPPVLPWQTAADQTSDTGIIFDVEVRDAATYYNQKGWFNLSSPSQHSGVMLAFAAPGLSPVTRSTQYAALDVLMINEEGVITQIMPDLMLSDLKKDIYPQNPILAILFLKGGTCKALSINPGDEVQYKLFRKPPTVLNAPNLAPPPQAAPAPAHVHH